MKKRFKDRLPFHYDFYHVLQTNGIQVKCPKCQQAALVIYSKEEEVANLRCSFCYHQKKLTYADYSLTIPQYRYNGICPHCEKFNRLEVPNKKQKTISTICKSCSLPYSLNLANNGKPVDYISRPVSYYLEQGLDPLTGQELYFLTSVKGHYFWALNEDHLHYLLNYIEADLRERPAYPVWKTASHTLPAFVKSAKNRQLLVKKIRHFIDH